MQAISAADMSSTSVPLLTGEPVEGAVVAKPRPTAAGDFRSTFLKAVWRIYTVLHVFYF